MVGSKIQRGISDLKVPSAVAYTGNKGIHVYGFTGKMPANEVREAANLVLSELMIRPIRGNAFFAFEPDATEGADLFTIELFPKQDTVKKTSGFGNLMRLPLGKNLKNAGDPTFFVDTEAPMGVLQPTDPVAVLNNVKEELGL
jgi:hypothetical protein